MKTQPMVEVRVHVEVDGVRHTGVGWYDRVPTAEECVALYLESYDGNERYRPGFTEAVLEMLARAGLPSLPPESFPPQVAASYDYPDGYVRVVRGLFCAFLDAPPAAPAAAPGD